MTTTLIVDDEPLARARLRRLLEAQGALVVGEADNAAMALQLSEDLQPEALFLDIQMPGLTGMQMASALTRLDNPPLIVFVTGYSEHALSAFEQGALDYLVKPVTQERLAVTLVRVRERLTDRQARATAHQTMAQATEIAPVPLRMLPIRADYAVRFLPLDSILYLFARDKKVFAMTEEGEHRTYYTLTQLESLLPSERFIRVHDSTIVNLDSVVELLLLGDHAYEVRLKNRQRVRVGRARYAELQRRLGLNNRPSV